MKPSILVIDDEPAIAEALRPVLEAKGFQVAAAETAADGLSFASENKVDVVLLDLGLPDADGKEIISKLQNLGSLAVIVLSARHQEAEKVASLDEGADDYVNKPFSIEELLARVRAALRRMTNAPARPLVFESRELQIDFGKREVKLLGDEVKLSPKEFELLRTLAEHAGQVVTQRRLLVAGWGDPATDTQYLRSYMGLLRQKLEYDPSEPQIILTEPGVGYRLRDQGAAASRGTRLS
ncbi:MAG TPA: response regulator [Sphingomonadaceae bacterium]|nr:response regulator [Sphingomonadaceae bacterium]